MKEISVRTYTNEARSEWQAFLAEASNATLFQDRDFLSYHPEGRFNERSLMFYEGGALKAVFPAAVSEGTLKSPFGASYGGLILKRETSVPAVGEILKALLEYEKRVGTSAIEMTLGPSASQEEPSDVLPFSLFRAGFQHRKSWLSFMVPLDFPHRDEMMARFSRSKRYDVRKSAERGVAIREGDEADLPAFFSLLGETYRRHETQPTHSNEEIARLFRLVPGRVRLFLAEAQGAAIAGVLVFILNSRTAYTFYICEANDRSELCGPAACIAAIQEKLHSEGLEYLDLGPSASSEALNEGVIFFKEGLGARGFQRTQWRWENL